MQVVAFKEVAAQWLVGGGDFPFRFARQPRTGPACEGIGLVIADVTDRCLQVQRAQATKGHLVPAGVLAQPVQRSVPAGLLDQVPAVRQPQLRAGITAVSDERQVFAVAHQSFGKLEILDELAMSRGFAIEGEIAAGMPDVLHTAGVFMPARALGAAGPGLGEIVAINRVQRVLREDVLDVHQQQFLVLLLVLQAEADAADDFGSLLARRIAQQFAHGLVDVAAIAIDLVHTRAG